MDQKTNNLEVTFWDVDLWITAGSWNAKEMLVLVQYWDSKVVLCRKDSLCLSAGFHHKGLSVQRNPLTTVQDWSLFQEHSLNIKVMPKQRPWWSSGCIPRKTLIFEDSRLLFLWRISSWMLPLKSLPVGNRMLINQTWWIFTGSFFYVDSRNKPFLQPHLKEKNEIV